MAIPQMSALPPIRDNHGSYSNSSPSGLEVPVLRACFPSTLSIVEYLGLLISVILLGQNCAARPTSTLLLQNCSTPSLAPSTLCVSSDHDLSGHFQLTGPAKSGTYSSNRATFARMNMNPMRVTMFGANHLGKSSTTAFHYLQSISPMWSSISLKGQRIHT
jgi:hypothetical protein